MMPKYLKKLLSNLQLPAMQADRLKQGLSRAQATYGKDTVRYTVKICRLLLKITQSLIQKRERLLVQVLVQKVRQILRRIRNEDLFQVQIVKIRLLLISTRQEYREKMNRVQRGEQTKKAKLFLQRLETNTFYPLLQEDFYSQLQHLYLEVIKGLLLQECPLESLSYANKCFTTMKKQVTVLSEFGTVKDQKFRCILESKGKVLQILFYLEHGCRLLSSQESSTQIMEDILPRYERLFQKMGLNLDKQFLKRVIDKGNGIIQQQVQSIMDSPKDSKVSEKYRISLFGISSSSLKKRNMSFQEGINISIKESIKFIKDIKDRQSLTNISSSSKKRTSLQLDPLPSQFGRSFNHSTDNTHVFRQSIQRNPIQEQSQKDSKGKRRSISMVLRQKKKDFDLILRAQRERRQKLLVLNPFKDKKNGSMQLQLDANSLKMFDKGIITLSAFA